MNPTQEHLELMKRLKLPIYERAKRYYTLPGPLHGNERAAIEQASAEIVAEYRERGSQEKGA